MTTPAFVQGNTAYQTSGTAASVLLASAPTSGNLLVAYLYSGSTVTTPAGWTLGHSEYYGYRYGYTFYKTSDGTETGFSATLSATNYASTIITEWSGAAFGAFTEINNSSTTSSMTFGPSSSPISASSIPLAFASFSYGQGTLTPGSPWTGQSSQSGSGQAQSGYYYESAPNAAATLTLVMGAVAPATSQSIIVWIDPSAASTTDNLGSATSSGGSTVLATLAFGVALAGAALGIGSGSSSIAQSQALAGSAQGSSLAIAGASQSLGFTGAAQGSASAQAALTPGLPLAGSAQGYGGAQGSLAQFLGLAGSSAGTGTASAGVTQQQALAGATDGAGFGSGSLTIPSASGLALTGQAYGSGFAYATVAQYVPLTGSATGASFGSAQIAQSASFAGSATGARSSLASIVQSAAFTGSAVGSASASAPLGLGVSLSGTAIGSGGGSGTLQSAIPSDYLPEPSYSLSIPPRSFLASLAARIFYAAISPRSFYRMNNAMTPAFPNAIDPAETKVLTIDATADLASGVTLTGVVGSPIITVTRGYDTAAAGKFTNAVVNTASIAAAPPGIPVAIAAGKAVQVIATGLTDGATYDVRIVCSTTDPDNVTTLKGVLVCTSI